MSAITLHRSDPARNMWRYYRLDVQPDLFGQWCFVREWGRTGSSGQTRSVPYPNPAQAEAALEKQRRAKERRGYMASIARLADTSPSGVTL
jgi:predicted DNA-binding WGR domain protein